MVANRDLSVRFEVAGLKAAAKEMRRWDGDISKAMRVANREIADELRSLVVSSAPPELQRSLRSGSTALEVQLKVGLRPAWAIGEFMGAKKRSGWYSDIRYAASVGRQFRPWVGNQWEPGERNGAPYYIGVPINRFMPGVEDAYLGMLEEMWLRAVDAKRATDSNIAAAVRSEL